MEDTRHTSERACDRCRERRVKCDKLLVGCLRCDKVGKPCPGYAKRRKFVDEGVGLRKKYALSSLNGGSEGEDPVSLVDTPCQASNGSGSHGSRTLDLFSSTESPITMPPFTPEHRLRSTNHLPETLPGLGGSIQSSEVPRTAIEMPEDMLLVAHDGALGNDGDVDALWNDVDFDPEWFNLEPSIYYADGNNSCGFVPNVDIVDEVDKQYALPSIEVPPLAGSLSASRTNGYVSKSQLLTSAIITDEREHEMAYLIRHFAESIGPWMDLFDRDRHFSHLVPLKALRDRLLRNAIAALSCKQLGRVKGRKLYLDNQRQKPATMEVIDEMTDGDWFYKAANYYDKAIAFSREYLQRLAGSLSNPTPSPQTSSSIAQSDDLLVAVSIFSLYESLDNLETGWLQHLTGLNSLMAAVSASQQEKISIVPSITVGRQASFWNFARADYQSAYINGQKTLLDTDDLDLWRSRGLEIRDDGSLYTNSNEIRTDQLHCRTTAQLVAHTLIWLLLKVTNHCQLDACLNSSQQLTNQLDSWYSSLPQTFQPCAKIRHVSATRLPRDDQERSGAPSHLTEVFFSIDQCAAAMQLYHFARILLLLNRPSTAVNRVDVLMKAPTGTIKHAKEIVGIALGRPSLAVRVEMLLPLYLAGKCLEAKDEKEMVSDLLRAIEIDTGCLSLIDQRGGSKAFDALAIG